METVVFVALGVVIAACAFPRLVLGSLIVLLGYLACFVGFLAHPVLGMLAAIGWTILLLTTIVTRLA